MIFNKTLSLIMMVCCALFVVGLIPITYIRDSISPWSYYLLFLIPIFLFVIISRFNKANDSLGKRLSYFAVISFIATPFFPLLLMILFWNSSFALEGPLSLIVLGFLPAVGIILSIYVAFRLWRGQFLDNV